MRSLQRNPWSKNSDGTPKAPVEYKSFLPDLKANFGGYCCYCETRVRKPDIEHVAPKSLNPSQACDWNNLLLACPICNRDYKKNKNPSRNDYVWPDIDDTFDMYEYQGDGSMLVNQSSPKRNDAQNTINLMHLNAPIGKNDEIRTIRTEQWYIASELLEDYKNGAKTTKQIERIVKNVVANGYWSVWMTVFKDYPEVTQKIADAFPGTLPKYCTPPANP